MLSQWMKEEKTTNWSTGLSLIQRQLNSCEDIEKDRMSEKFSQITMFGLKSTTLSPETISTLQNEDDLNEVCFVTLRC